MAKNMVYKWRKTRPLVATDPATPASGDPVLAGQTAGVALTAENADGVTTVALDGQFTLSVKGLGTGGANSAVADGDIVYYVPGNTPKLSKASDGAGAVRFGYARGTVGSGATATIPVEVGY
jgi:predicted RecA/RadA family phage recombinase